MPPGVIPHPKIKEWYLKDGNREKIFTKLEKQSFHILRDTTFFWTGNDNLVNPNDQEVLFTY